VHGLLQRTLKACVEQDQPVSHSFAAQSQPSAWLSHGLSTHVRETLPEYASTQIWPGAQLVVPQLTVT
jgi:hypothetical protein